MAQTHPAHQIIIVDDGSSDDSVQVVVQLKQRYPQIELVRHETNRGAVAAFDSGAARATGDLITFPAADDHILPDLYRHAAAALEANAQAAFFCSDVVLLDAQNKILGFRPPVPPSWTCAYISPIEVRRRSRLSDNWYVGQSVVYRRAMFDTVGYDETVGSMTDGVTNRLLAFRYGFVYEPRVLATWRVYPQSYSARSALSPTESMRLLAAARIWGEKHYPPDIRTRYVADFDRRSRFSMARLHLVWAKGSLDWRSIADLAEWHGFDRKLAQAFAAIPKFGEWPMLAWLTIRLRPFSLTATFAAFLRAGVLNFSRHQDVQRAFADADTRR